MNPLRLATPRVATVLAAVTLLLLLAALPLSALAHNSSWSGAGTALLAVAFAVVGAIVARGRPRNPIGWTLIGSGFFLALTAVAGSYAIDVYRRHDHLPLGPVFVLLQPMWAPAIFCFMLSILLFPDGELPSGRWWRWAVGLLAVSGAVWMLGAFAIAGQVIAEGKIAIEPTGDLVRIDHPTHFWQWWNVSQAAFFVIGLCVALAWLASCIPAYRRATGDRRQQLKWLLVGGSAAAIGGVMSVLLSGRSGVLNVIAGIALVGVLGIPISIGVGMMKYRLYEIDRLISRTLSYALLTGALLVVFAGLVLLTTRVLPFSSPVGVAASTLAAASLFNPLRGRVQRWVDRRFNRARYDADALVGAFSSRLRNAVDLDTVESALLETATRAVEPAHVGLTLVRK